MSVSTGTPSMTPPPVPSTEIAPRDVEFTLPLVSALCTLLALRGHALSPTSVHAALGGEQPTPAAILRAAQSLRVCARIFPRAPLASISELTLPCVLLLRENQACVFLGMDSAVVANVILPESAPEQQKVSLENLTNAYTGFALFAVTEGKTDIRGESLQLLRPRRWFWDALTHHWPLYRDVALASMIINCLALASPLFTMNVYDRVVPTNAQSTLWVLAIGVAIAHIMDFILRGLRSHFVDLAGRNADVILASKLMSKVLNIRLDAKPESTGGIVNNIREFEQLREFFSSTSLLAVVDLPFLLIFLFLVAYIGGPIVTLPMLALPLMVGLGLAMQIPLQRLAEKGFKQNMLKNALLTEVVGGLETVKATLAKGRMRALWENAVDASAVSTRASKRLSSLAAGGSVLILNLVNVGVIIWGAYRIGEGAMTMGGLIACSILVSRAMTPLMQLATMVTQMQRSRMTLQSLNLLMDLPEEQEDPHAMDASPLPATFEFKNIRFAYPQAEHMALDDVSFPIRQGEKVGIIGRAGSGKSTLARLLISLYQPSEGMVSFGNVDIRQLNLSTLRDRVGFLPQDNYLFYGTVRENIALGYPEADERIIVRAAGIAGVTDFIKSHPHGFNMQVGERGMSLSGGQRQCVALARALLRDPDVLILDEPSSNLDTASERMLIMRLRAIARNKTIVVLTHRLSMLDMVDRVIMLEGGRIVADGPRDTILKSLTGGRTSSRAPTRDTSTAPKDTIMESKDAGDKQ